MSMNEEIQRFLNNVDPKIFRRGLDYYRSDMVEHIQRDGNQVTAEVSGSGAAPYQAELTLGEDGAVLASSCTCPYDWGPVCKHTVAALLALQAGKTENSQDSPPEKPAPNAAKRKAALQKLVDQAEKESLAALILEHCQEDKRFQCRVLSELEDNGELELDAIKALVRETIRANTRHGFIDTDGCDNICSALDDVLDQVRRRVQRRQWGQALEITRFVLLTGAKLAGEADSSSGALLWTIAAALETITLAAKGLAKSGEDRTRWVKGLLKTAREPAFDGWPDWRYDLLRRTAVLADASNEDAFYETLSNLSDRRWEAFRDGPRYDNQDKLIRYYVIRYAHGTEEGRSYLKRYLFLDPFRELLIRDYINEGDYISAEQLCRERLESEEPEEPRYRPSQWQYLLYEIYRGARQREKQIQQARKLALMGDRDFYQATKDLLTKDGR